MKTHPMLFSTPMVQALLDGRKTQTRRILKPQPVDAARFGGFEPDGQALFTRGSFYAKIPLRIKQGDFVWVKESFCPNLLTYGHTFHYRADGYHVVCDDGDGYTAHNKDGTEKSPWKASMFMPRNASRVTLKITDVRVERLQDISGIDACAEGVTWLDEGRGAEKWGVHGAIDYKHDTPCEAYSSLWNSINGANAWDENPFVVALTFEVIKQNIDQYLSEAT